MKFIHKNYIVIWNSKYKMINSILIEKISKINSAAVSKMYRHYTSGRYSYKEFSYQYYSFLKRSNDGIYVTSEKDHAILFYSL